MQRKFRWGVFFPIYCIINIIALFALGKWTDWVFHISIWVSILLLILYIGDKKKKDFDDLSACDLYIFYLFFNCMLSLYFLMSPKKDSSNIVGYFGVNTGKYTFGSKSVSHWLKYKTICNDSLFEQHAHVDKTTFDSNSDTLRKVLISGTYILKWNATIIDSLKAKYAIIFKQNENIEIGNDSYEYARFEPTREYENFGFNVVYMSTQKDDSNISWKTITGKSLKMNVLSDSRDTFLVYSNINPKFFDGWHACPDSISTPENFAKIEEGGYGYIFRGKIYSKEETEKYWNIIEQYKLRETGK